MTEFFKDDDSKWDPAEDRFEIRFDENGRRYVSCDSNCEAFEEPENCEEYKAAWEHWSAHGYLSGCSHGC